MSSIGAKLSILFVLSILETINSEVFSSVYKLQILSESEVGLFRALKQYRFSMIFSGNIVSSDLSLLYDETQPIFNNRSHYVSYAENPINVLHLLNRFLNVWPAVLDILFCKCCVASKKEKAFNVTYNIVQQAIGEWPTEYDLKAAMRSLLRLRTTYYLKIEELIKGIIYDEHIQPLSWSLVGKIIKQAIDMKMLEEATLWSDTFLPMIPHFQGISDPPKTEMILKQTKAKIYSKINIDSHASDSPYIRVLPKAGFNRQAANLLREYKHSGTTSVIEDFNKYVSKSRGQTAQFVEHWFTPPGSREIDNKEKQLCRGEIFKSSAEMQKLKCYTRNTAIPYYKAKTEEMHLEPQVLVFHDVIYDNEIEYLKMEGAKRFKRSSLQNKGKPVGTDDETRVSFTGWVNDQDDISRKISKRVQLITGLDTTYQDKYASSEAFQVVNYGTGGFFNTHYDNLYNPIWGPPSAEDVYYVQGSGDRIATWMFYINDVKVGGATIFPKLNTRIPVIKGAAAFWYNLLPNGKIDRRVFHGGCPVLLGSKWITNKWIRESGQMHRRPCLLRHDDTT